MCTARGFLDPNIFLPWMILELLLLFQNVRKAHQFHAFWNRNKRSRIISWHFLYPWAEQRIDGNLTTWSQILQVNSPELDHNLKNISNHDNVNGDELQFFLPPEKLNYRHLFAGGGPTKRHKCLGHAGRLSQDAKSWPGCPISDVWIRTSWPGHNVLTQTSSPASGRLRRDVGHNVLSQTSWPRRPGQDFRVLLYFCPFVKKVPLQDKHFHTNVVICFWSKYACLVGRQLC